MTNVTFVWGGDEAGLWDGNELLATLDQLERNGYSVDYMLSMSQKQLEYHARKIRRDTALPASVGRGNIEDFLG